MTDHRENLLKGDAKRQMEKYGKIVEYSNYAITWHTGDSATLCGPCATEAIAEYIEHKDDEDYVFYDGELPEACSTVEEGPPVYCEECNQVIFEGFEQCEICKEWDDSENLTWRDDLNGTVHGRCET